MKVSLAALFVAAQAVSALAAPSFVSQYELDGSSSRRAEGSLIDRLRGEKMFSRFVEVLEKERGLRDELENRDKQTTVFAPTNEAFKRIEDEYAATGGEMPSMRDLLRYHIAGDSEISADCLHAGALIPTNLRLKSLNDRHQRIRVFRFHDMVWLNMMARVVESDIKAENGRIHAIDRVLCPPQSVPEMIATLPTEFSTFSWALERTGLNKEATKEKGVTVFAPSNRAWAMLGHENLKFLFSCVGQKTEREDQHGVPVCKGVKELKKIVKNHVATDLAYSTDFMEKETMKLRTLGDIELTVCAKKRQGGSESRRGGEGGQHKDVRRYNFIVNDGEARISFTDGLAGNGAIQVVDNVLIGDVKLPHDQMME